MLLAAHVLSLQDVHHRLVYGSDYPVPAINLVVHTSKMQRYSLLWFFAALPCAYSPSLPPPSLGLITSQERAALNELYNYNPLLFDFACKRLVRGPGGERFPPSLFKAHPQIPPCRSSDIQNTASVAGCHGSSLEVASLDTPAENTM